MKLNMDSRRFLIQGIDDYERGLDAIGLDSDESDESDEGSGGLMVRAPACRSRTVVRFHLRRFEAWAISFTPLCPCVSEETLKAVGPNSCVSSRLGCLEYNYLRLEKALCC